MSGEPMPGCPECGGIYRCAKECSLLAARQNDFARMAQAMCEQHRVEEAEKGELIAAGENGVYTREENDALTIVAFNQGGHDCTIVDVADVLRWLRKNKPELLR